MMYSSKIYGIYVIIRVYIYIFAYTYVYEHTKMCSKSGVSCRASSILLTTKKKTMIEELPIFVG